MNGELNHKTNAQHERRNNVIGGIAFIALGFFWLANEFLNFDIGALVLPGLAAIFIVWGILTRESGLLVPGGVLAGVATGVMLMSTLDLGPGVFLLGLAAGFASITVLSALFTDDKCIWALWPAGIIALIGFALLVGGAALTVLSLAGRLWPVVLIFIGLSIIFRRR